MVRCKVSRNMDACPRYLCTCVYVIVCMSARKKAPVNLLMCPFELYMFIGVSMQLRVVSNVLIPYCWSVALEKLKKKIRTKMYSSQIRRHLTDMPRYPKSHGSSEFQINVDAWSRPQAKGTASPSTLSIKPL